MLIPFTITLLFLALTMSAVFLRIRSGGASPALPWPIFSNKHKRELDALREHQCRMIIDLSHGLQTPLAILKGRVERLEQGVLRDGQADGLRQSVDAAAGFVNDLLEYARLEYTIKADAKLLFSLSDLVESVCVETAIIAESERIELTHKAGSGIMLFGNEGRIGEALVNLISNAVKYMGSSTVRRIGVSLTERGGQLLLEVADTGMGIPENELPHIFERFYRGSNRVYGTVPGTGLGLAIVERIVKEHGGVITVTSELGKGSSFTLILPRAKQARLKRRRS